jgi:glutaminyl-tRNA synthetase
VSAARGVTCEVRLYDKLFTVPDPEAQGDDVDFTTFVNPDSIRVMSNAKVEPSVLGDAPDARYQFERTGYFVKDVADWRDERPVFNRTVTLRDTWAKVKGA